jgi:hypothetical protein
MCLRSAIFLIAASAMPMVAGCAKHPVEVLRRQAAKEERAISRNESEVFSDSRYFVPLPDAVAATVEVLEHSGRVTDVSEDAVSSDWGYDGSVVVEEAGESFQQHRERAVVSLNPVGAELEVSVVAVEQRRTLRAGGGTERWSEEKRAADLPSVRTRLQSLERAHVSVAAGSGRSSQILDVLARSLPGGFEVESREGGRLTAVRSRSQRKDWERRGKWATWDARETLSGSVDGESKAVYFRYVLENRFTTEEGEGGWEPSATVDAGLSVDWLAAAIRAGGGKGNVRLGPGQLPAVGTRHQELSEPPPHPRLRTISEIEEIIRRRAFEKHLGNFTVCLDYVVINPTSASGYDWDIPGVSNVLQATETVADYGAGRLGKLNEVGDQQPVVGMLTDAAVSYVTSGAVDRKQLESITRTTGKVAGWTARHLPVKPDVEGFVNVAGVEFTMREHENTLKIKPNFCATANFGPQSAAAAMQFWDVDVTENDPIGQCTVAFGTVIDRGISGISCGYARAYMSARYNFSFGQIKIVGLPPSE